MSRLGRPFLYDRYIFVTVDLLRGRGKLEERDFGDLSGADATKAAICTDGLGFSARPLARDRLPALSGQHLASDKCGQGELDGRNQPRQLVAADRL